MKLKNMYGLSSIEIDFKKIFHYILIYMFFIIPGSSLYTKILPSFPKYAILILLIILSIYIVRIRNLYTLFGVGLFSLFTIITRFATSGGVGLQSLSDFIIVPLVCGVAIFYDQQNFATRFIKLATFFFSLSLIFFVIQLVNPSFFDSGLFEKYYSLTLGTQGYETIQFGRGYLLYSSYLEAHPTRNCGIFTEPGVYQVVINFAILLLLFFNEKINMSNKNKLICLIIAIVTLLTGTSTTGFLGFLIILLLFVILKTTRNTTEKRMKNAIITITILSIIALLFNFFAVGSDSIIQKVLLDKLFVDGSVDVSNGSGLYRQMLIENSIDIMIKFPFGSGYGPISEVKGAGAGAAFFTFGAVFGLYALVCIVLWLLYPFLKKSKWLYMLLFTLLFINTSFAQTYLLYPGIMCIPYLMYCSKE